jgi:hypothetical protein
LLIIIPLHFITQRTLRASRFVDLDSSDISDAGTAPSPPPSKQTLLPRDVDKLMIVVLRSTVVSQLLSEFKELVGIVKTVSSLQEQ